MKRFFGFFCVLLTLAVSSSVFQSLVSADSGPKLFINGSIYIDAGQKVQNLLIRNGSVEAYNVEPSLYKDAEIVDLNGAAAYPGFNDSHVHLAETGYFFHVGANLIGCKNADDIVKVLEEKVKGLPANATVFGGGFSLRDYDKWTLEDLAKIDKVTGDRPAFLADKLGHNAIINSATIKLSGMTAATDIPLGGKMGVKNGQLTGMLRESAMILPWDHIATLFNKQGMKDGAMLLAQDWASKGYTGVVDLMGGPGVRYMHPEIFWELEKEGKLPLRVNYCYTIFNLGDVDDAAKYIGKDTEQTHFVGCKIFVDGAFAGGQAWTTWQNLQGGHGLQEIYTDDIGGPGLNLNRIVAKVEEYGMNMHYHTQGDMAIGAVLDALDKKRAGKGQIKGIHTLIHLAFPTDEQIARIKGFNGHVIATVQPGFWPIEDDTAYYYGDRAAQSYPVKKIIDSGVSAGMSTDFSVSPPQYTPPTVIMGVAVTGGGNPAMHPPLTVKDMIKGFGEGSARTTGKKDLGRLDIGYKADMVIFDQDMYNVSKEAFSRTNPKVLATYVGGVKMYDAGKK